MHSSSLTSYLIIFVFVGKEKALYSLYVYLELVEFLWSILQCEMINASEAHVKTPVQ